MANSIVDFIKQNKAVKEFINDTKIEYVTDDVIGTAFLVAAKYLEKRQKIMIVTSNLYNSQRVYDLLTTLVSDDDCLFFPVDELLRTDLIAESKEMISQRLYVLNEMLTKDSYIVITHTSAFCKFLPSPQLFKENTISIKVGDTINLTQIKEMLLKLGYANVHKLIIACNLLIVVIF